MSNSLLQLRGAAWRKYTDATVTLYHPDTDEPHQVPVVLRRVPEQVSASFFESAKKEGFLGEDGKPTSTEGGIRLLAGLTALCLFEPGALRPTYNALRREDVDELAAEPWLMQLQEDVLAAVGATGAVVEKLKDFSEATQTQTPP